MKHFDRFAIVACMSMGLSVSVAQAAPGSVELFANAAGDYDYIVQTDIPAGFGDAEFTFELWIRPNESFPVGPVGSGSNQRNNWSNVDNAPYSNGSWWFSGNFLLDGHNNNSFANGTFTLQFYGSGRVRWLFGDGASAGPGGHWSVGAYPANSAPSLLDGQWHQVTLVRRWSGASSATLEIWIDGSLIGSEVSSARTDMRQWWDNWAGFPGAQRGWFWGAEKQAAIGALSQYEDYKGLVDEIRFWSRAKSSAEISSGFADPVTGNEAGLVGNYTFGEGSGSDVCDNLVPTVCMQLVNAFPGVWSTADAPVSGGGDSSAPTVPANLNGAAVSSSRIDLTWSASSDNIGVTGYEVRRDGALVTTTVQTSFSDTALTADTTYTYTVAARDAAGNVSAQSAAVNVATPAVSDTQAPTVPTGLQANAASSSSIQLMWSASSDNVGVSGYELRRDGALVTTTAQTSFTDTGLAPNTSYSYTVAARDAAGNVSAESGAVDSTTQMSSDTQAPSTPTGLQGSAVSTSRIDLSWNASSDNVGVTGYEVRRDGALVTTTAQTTFSDTALTANTAYAYTVTARDAAGNVSAQSAAINVTTPAVSDTQAPTVPTGLQANAASSSSIQLMWSASSDNVGVSGYEVRRDGALVTTTAQTSFTDTGLAPNTSYSYTVAARDAAGNVSAESGAVDSTTQMSSDTQAPSTPTGLQGSAVSASRVDLSWNASSDNVGVTGYEVRRNGALVTTTAQTTFSDTALAANTAYAYTVTARDAAGNQSAASASVSVTTSANSVASSGGGGSISLYFLALLFLTASLAFRSGRTPQLREKIQSKV